MSAARSRGARIGLKVCGAAEKYRAADVLAVPCCAVITHAHSHRILKGHTGMPKGTPPQVIVYVGDKPTPLRS